jgi:arsenate reductase
VLTFICYPKCTTCQKAKALLDSYNVEYEVRDIKTAHPTYDELKEWLVLSELSVKKFFNTSGQLYKSLGLKDKLSSMSEDECLKLLATDGMLVKRPLLVDNDSVLVGFNHNEWESALINMVSVLNSVTKVS